MHRLIPSDACSSALVRKGAKLKQQLHIQVSQNYPSYKKFFSEIVLKSVFAFWEKYPSPDLLFCTLSSPNTKGNTPDEMMDQNASSAAEIASLLRANSNNVCSLSKAEKIVELVKADGMEMRPYQEQRNFLIQAV